MLHVPEDRGAQESGLFDERFFMYFEDTDLSRRIHSRYRTVMYSHVSVFHAYDRRSRRDLRLLRIHISSAVKYFNKWGWFFDRERAGINRKTTAALRERELL